jgi:hypothetical protein
MGTVFWDAKRCIPVYFLPRKENNTVRYVQLHQKLQHALCDKYLMKIQIILQHSSADPHTAHLTLGMMGKFGWEVLPHTACSLDLAPLKYHLFKPFKDHMRSPAL